MVTAEPTEGASVTVTQLRSIPVVMVPFALRRNMPLKSQTAPPVGQLLGQPVPGLGRTLQPFLQLIPPVTQSFSAMRARTHTQRYKRKNTHFNW